jgi:lipopolysaccharide heptosyltransferase I
VNLLIVKLGSIGDIVHTLPALAAIRQSLPEAQISWAVEKRAAEILRDNRLLSRLIEVDTKAIRRQATLGETLRILRRQISYLRTSTFDLALDFQGLIKSAVIAKLSGAKRRFGFSRRALRERQSRWLLTDTIEVPIHKNIIIKNLSLAAQALQIAVPQIPADFNFPIQTNEIHEQEAEKVIAQINSDFAILNPGGGWATKLWKAENFGLLADKIWENTGLHSIISIGPGEEDLARRAVNASRTGKILATNLSLRGFYVLSRRARICVGGDTGPTHLAVAAGTPVVGLFGPTEWWRNGSPRPEDICVERNDIGCRENCHRRACNNWICLNIEVETVWQAVKRRLELIFDF